MLVSEIPYDLDEIHFLMTRRPCEKCQQCTWPLIRRMAPRTTKMTIFTAHDDETMKGGISKLVYRLPEELEKYDWVACNTWQH